MPLVHSDYRRIAGALLFLGVAQFLLCIIAAEAFYPNYLIHNNAISDLGVGSTAWLFNCTFAT